MDGIFILNDDALLHILQHLHVADKIAFAYTCKRFRQMCEDRSLLRKVDLSRYFGTQQSAIRDFFQDNSMIQHIIELNLNNSSVIFQTNINLKKLIKSCPHLEALHVLHCGLSIQSLQPILRYASKLTALSCSIMELSRRDIISLKHICLENIRNLHIEMLLSEEHFEILNYFVLSQCKSLESLQAYIWELPDMPEFEWGTKLLSVKPSSSTSDTLQRFHSMKIVAKLISNSTLCERIYPIHYPLTHFNEFAVSIARKKSRQTKWKSFIISPTLYSLILLDVFTPPTTSLVHHSDELDSIEEFSANGQYEQLITLFERMNDGVVRNLLLGNLEYFNQLLHPIVRVGGNALQSLFLVRVNRFNEVIDVNLLYDTLFSACTNIRELCLNHCHFEKNICKPLARLEHLVKIQVMQCAIAPNNNEEKMNEDNAHFLFLVENCQNVAEFKVYGCSLEDHSRNECKPNFPCLTDDKDLMPLTMWRKLQSLTCLFIPSILTFTLLKGISEHCKLLTTLKICVIELDMSYLPTFQCAKVLKHLVLHGPNLYLGSLDLWKLFSSVISLERLCIQCDYNGYLSIPGAVKMLESLTRLHVLHLHFLDGLNFKDFNKQVTKALERSNRSSCFEFLLQKRRKKPVFYKIKFPINTGELCYY